MYIGSGYPMYIGEGYPMYIGEGVPYVHRGGGGTLCTHDFNKLVLYVYKAQF